jgi:hypothetical protein
MALFDFNAETFRDTRVGCLGGVLLVLLTAGAFLGLVYMVWWMVARNEAAP